MDIATDKLLVMASDATCDMIKDALSGFSGLDIFVARDGKAGLAMIHDHRFALVITEAHFQEGLWQDIANTLSKQSRGLASPLLILSKSAATDIRLDPYQDLLIDHLPLPLVPGLFQARIRIFLELYQNKTAVSQSIDELDKVYQGIMARRQRTIQSEKRGKKALDLTAAASVQMKYPLKKIRGGIYSLLRSRDLPADLRPSLGRIRNAVKQLGDVTRRLNDFPLRAENRSLEVLDRNGVKRPCRILYAINSTEEFHIFQHYLSSMVNHYSIHAAGIEDAMEKIIQNRLDIIFIDHLLKDGTGLELLSHLARIGHDTPVIFTADQTHSHAGAKSLAKGAMNFYLKEELSGKAIKSIVSEALERARVTREMIHARDRIVVISRRDHLTQLFNRPTFDKALNTEGAKALRYNQPLSLVLMSFKNLNALKALSGPDASDMVLTGCAAITNAMVRTIDRVCRFEEDKFGLILPGTGRRGAGIMARRLLDHLLEHKFEYENQPPFYLSLNMGVATFAGNQAPETTKPAQDIRNRLTDLALRALDEADSSDKSPIKTLCL